MQGSHVICLSSLKNSLQCHRVMMSVFLHDHLHLAGDTNCGSSSWGFFSFSWSWILVKNLKRKTKLFFHHFMYLSVASSRTRSAMIYNESILLCCSLPCMWVSMQISLLCTGRNFPPWISSNRHMWRGWGGGHYRGCWWCRDGMYIIVISQCKSHLKRCKSLSILNFSVCFQRKGTYVCLRLLGKKHFEWKF